MDHARQVLLHFFHELVSIFGRNGAVTIIVLGVVVFLVLTVLFVLSGYLLLKFGEATLHGTSQFISDTAKVFQYHPHNASGAIKIELYLERILGVIALLCVVLIAGHALIPWVKEQSETNLVVVIICSLVLFAFLAYQSMRIETHHPNPRS